ncbi:hypothetical protein BDV28DRAFT_34856 [Aspergillus coremiiformis]|uniref:Uncharacterized protein n=1 Tax=Aspergillus coremiiformis TaxID=138285 RepID=A0A5N6ZF92_9EURO|nr:hypothetical protein BDV28DRAFT_34856 [Aspergillus coremiiformis]
MLREKSTSVNEADYSKSDVSLSLTVDRAALSPCVIASTVADFTPSHTEKFTFVYSKDKFSNSESPMIKSIASHLRLPDAVHEKLAGLIQKVWQSAVD